jgi:uroporphyrinogen decarboxylase
MTSRERISTILSGGVPDRVGMDEDPWGETYALWAKQGMPEGTDIIAYFDMDLAKVGGPDTSFQFEIVEIAEDDTYRTFRDSRGVTCKVHKFESGHTPHWLDHLIHDQESWKANVARLAPKRDRLAADVVEQYANARKSDRFVAVCMADPYENAWPTFGQVGIFTLMMDDPDFVGHVMMTYAELMVGLFEIMEELGCDYDGIFMFADLGYRNSTLFNPELYRKLVQPAHALVCDWQRAHGRPVICHSCGKIDVLIPNFIEAGMAAIQPLEAKCGQDVRELKKLYGKDITFFGNMDIRKLSGTREDVYEEVMGKLPIAMEGGGYIFHSDHSVPPTVSWDNYCYAVELVKKYGVY